MTDETEASTEDSTEKMKYSLGSQWRSAINLEAKTEEGSVVLPEGAIVQVVQDPRQAFHSIDIETGTKVLFVQVEYGGNTFLMEAVNLEPLTSLH